MDGIDGQLIFLVLFVVIGAIKWLIEKVQGGQQQHDISDSLEDMYEDFREEIRQRQTQVQQPAQTPPPLPRQTQQQPHIPSVPPASAQPGNFKVKKATLSAEEQAALERFQSHGKRKTKRTKAASGSVRALLSSPDSARQAIILKEILGEPRSMQRI